MAAAAEPTQVKARHSASRHMAMVIEEEEEVMVVVAWLVLLVGFWNMHHMYLC